ncbi:hypothetical protein BDR26DRAFT_919486 [Obelidium mucronatum]|nr:hypothetical protein BDR26DRAFT_919486 [Obelidium mucronatum]
MTSCIDASASLLSEVLELRQEVLARTERLVSLLGGDYKVGGISAHVSSRASVARERDNNKEKEKDDSPTAASHLDLGLRWTGGDYAADAEVNRSSQANVFGDKDRPLFGTRRASILSTYNANARASVASKHSKSKSTKELADVDPQLPPDKRARRLSMRFAKPAPVQHIASPPTRSTSTLAKDKSKGNIAATSAAASTESLHRKLAKMLLPRTSLGNAMTIQSNGNVIISTLGGDSALQRASIGMGNSTSAAAAAIRSQRSFKRHQRKTSVDFQGGQKQLQPKVFQAAALEPLMFSSQKTQNSSISSGMQSHQTSEKSLPQSFNISAKSMGESTNSDVSQDSSSSSGDNDDDDSDQEKSAVESFMSRESVDRRFPSAPVVPPIPAHYSLDTINSNDGIDSQAGSKRNSTDMSFSKRNSTDLGSVMMSRSKSIRAPGSKDRASRDSLQNMGGSSDNMMNVAATAASRLAQLKSMKGTGALKQTIGSSHFAPMAGNGTGEKLSGLKPGTMPRGLQLGPSPVHDSSSMLANYRFGNSTNKIMISAEEASIVGGGGGGGRDSVTTHSEDDLEKPGNRGGGGRGTRLLSVGDPNHFGPTASPSSRRTSNRAVILKTEDMESTTQTHSTISQIKSHVIGMAMEDESHISDPAGLNSNELQSPVPVESPMASRLRILYQYYLVCFLLPAYDNKGRKLTLDQFDEADFDSIRFWVNGLHPKSYFNTVWDFVMSIAYFVILWIIPYVVAFNGPWTPITLFITFVFSANTFMSTITPQSQNVHEMCSFREYESMRPSLSGWFNYYICTWLVVDVIASLPFDLLFPDTPHSKYLLLLRLLRFYELPNIISRCAIYRKLKYKLEEHIGIGISKVLPIAVVIFFYIHFNACSMYLAGGVEGFVGWRGLWPQFEEAGSHQIYTWTLFQAVGNIFPMSFKPQTETEQIVAIVYIVIGAAIYASFLGYISSAAMSLNPSGRLYNQKMEELLDYVKWKKLDDETREKLISYYETKYRGKYFEEDTLLSDMNESLRADISLHNTRSLIEKVPFLRRTENDGRDEIFFYRIATVLHAHYFIPGDFITKQGDSGHDMFFILSGKVNVFVNGVKVVSLYDGAYIGEVALITRVLRTATVQAAMPSVLYRLTFKDFHAVISEFTDMKLRIQKLAMEGQKMVMAVEDNRSSFAKGAMAAAGIQRKPSRLQ